MGLALWGALLVRLNPSRVGCEPADVRVHTRGRRWALVVVTLVLMTANGCAVVNEDLDLESRLARRGFTSPVVESDGTVGGAGLLEVAFTMAPHQELLDQRVMEASRLAWTTYDYRFDEVRVTVRRGTATTRRTLSREALQAAFGPRPAQLKDRTIAAQETRSDVALGVGLLAFVMLVTTAVWLLVVFLRRARPSEQRPAPYWRPQPAPAFGGSPALPLAGGSHYHPTARTQPPPTPRPVLDPGTARRFDATDSAECCLCPSARCSLSR